MTQVGVHEAKTHLSRLLQRVEMGEEIVITRGGTPVAVLSAVPGVARRSFGHDRALFSVPEDFDTALPASIIADFEG